MTIHIDEKSAAPKTLKPAQLPRAVSITHGEAHPGRLPVTVTVVPVADLDAKGGVYVDFRMGSKEVAPRLDAEATGRTAVIEQGDKAIEAMAAREAAAGAPAQLGPEETTKPSLAAAAEPAKKATKQPLVSHQIAKSMKLTIGQSETLRAEVAVPLVIADAAQAWYVRGRFATLGGKDLTSEWLQV